MCKTDLLKMLLVVKGGQSGYAMEFLKFSIRLSAELLQPFNNNIIITAKGKLNFIAESSFI